MQCGRVESKKGWNIKRGMRGVNTYVQIRATQFLKAGIIYMHFGVLLIVFKVRKGPRTKTYVLWFRHTVRPDGPSGRESERPKIYGLVYEMIEYYIVYRCGPGSGKSQKSSTFGISWFFIYSAGLSLNNSSGTSQKIWESSNRLIRTNYFGEDLAGVEVNLGHSGKIICIASRSFSLHGLMGS